MNLDPGPSAVSLPLGAPTGRRAGRFRAATIAVLRWCGAVMGTTALIVSLSVAGVYIAALTQADQSASEALIAIGGSVATGTLLGVLALYISARVYAKVVFAILAVVLVTAGFLMLTLAPVLRQMDTPELAERRAYASLLSFGAASLISGVVLAAFCLRWALRPGALRRLSRWSRLLGSAYGVMQGISGLIILLSLLTLINKTSAFEQRSIVEQAIGFAAIGAISLVPGLILTYHGISASMGEGSGEFRLPPAFTGFAVYAGVLSAGGLIMLGDPPFAAPMPLWHAAAAALPGLTLVAMAARGSALRGSPVRWLTWRQVTVAMAVAMTVGVSIAGYVESVGSFGSVLLLLVHNGAFEFARDSSDVWDIIRNSRFILSRDEQYFANLITASLLAPLIEEFGKGLGVRFMMRRAVATRAQAFLMGAAAGAGFGFIEANLYGVGGIQHDLRYWWAIMLLRGGSTSLHVLATSLVGLGWWHWSVEGQRRKAWMLFGTAVLLHATWNGIAVTLDSRILGLDTLSQRNVEYVAYGIVAVLSICFVTAIPLIARRLADPPPTVEGTPLAVMSPWLG